MLLGLADWELTLVVTILSIAGPVMVAMITIVPHYLKKDKGNELPVLQEADACRLKVAMADQVKRLEDTQVAHAQAIATMHSENAARDERMKNVLRTLDEVRTDQKEMIKTLQDIRSHQGN